MNPAADLRSLIDAVLPLVTSGALGTARPLGFMMIFPIFGWIGLKGMVRNVVALGIAIPMIPAIYQTMAFGGTYPAQSIALLVGKEVLVGAALGAALGAPFWAAELAGGYLDFYRGASAGTVMNPSQNTESLISGAVFTLGLIGVFIATGGMRTTLGALYDSWVIWPVFDPTPSVTAPLFPFFHQLLSKIAHIALALGAPLLIAMFLSELLLALISRFAQQINVFDATLGVKNLVYLLLLPPYLLFLLRIYGPEALDVSETMAAIDTVMRGVRE